MQKWRLSMVINANLLKHFNIHQDPSIRSLTVLKAVNTPYQQTEPHGKSHEMHVLLIKVHWPFSQRLKRMCLFGIILLEVLGERLSHIQSLSLLALNASSYSFVCEALYYETEFLTPLNIKYKILHFTFSQVADQHRWIGLYRDATQCDCNSGNQQTCEACRASWSWIDGTPMSWWNWHVGEPHENKCGRVLTHAWRENNCSIEYGHICERRKWLNSSEAQLFHYLSA